MFTFLKGLVKINKTKDIAPSPFRISQSLSDYSQNPPDHFYIGGIMC